MRLVSFSAICLLDDKFKCLNAYELVSLRSIWDLYFKVFAARVLENRLVCFKSRMFPPIAFIIALSPKPLGEVANLIYDIVKFQVSWQDEVVAVYLDLEFLLQSVC